MSVRAHIDRISAGSMEGWAVDDEDYMERPGLEVWVDGRLQGITFARDFRPDLKDAEIGDGWHAFFYRFAPPVRRKGTFKVEIRLFPTGVPLAFATVGEEADAPEAPAVTPDQFFGKRGNP